MTGLEKGDTKEKDDQFAILDTSKLHPDKLSRLRQQIKSRQGRCKRHK